jgi:2-iminoacetate synthase ThiH
VRNRTNEEELRRIISDAGYMPVQRDTLYRCYYLKQDSAAAAAVAVPA